MASGRASIDTIEDSESTYHYDIDDNIYEQVDATNSVANNQFSENVADLFDTDDDDDDDENDTNNDHLSDDSSCIRRKCSQSFINNLKQRIFRSLASTILETFLADQQSTIQRYSNLLCTKNSSNTFRLQLRPTSLPSRPLLRNRLLLPCTSSLTSTNPVSLQVMTGFTPMRSVLESNAALTSLLQVTPLRVAPVPSTAIATGSTSPRKMHTMPISTSIERAVTPVVADRRNPSQVSIALIGTGLVNLPLSSASSQNQMRPLVATCRYRSTTPSTANYQHVESATRLPPITIERLTSHDQLVISRSHTMSSTTIEPILTASKTITSTNSRVNSSSTAKFRASAHIARLTRASRSMTLNSYINKNQFSSVSSSARSTASNALSLTTLKTTNTSRMTQSSHKRSLIAAKMSKPASSSSPMGISTTQMYPMKTEQHSRLVHM
jgi:hypothetical protein